MARDDDRLVGHAHQRRIRPADHSVDAATDAVVYERIVAIPKNVAERQHVRVAEVNGYVAISVARAKVFEHDSFAIKIQDLLRFENDGRTCADGPGLKGVVPIFDARSAGETL